jgi:hypothetical protein
MNELVHPDRGILVAAPETEPRHLGTNFKVDPDALESAITAALSMSEEDRTSIQRNAKHWALENHRSFEERFIEILAKVT